MWTAIPCRAPSRASAAASKNSPDRGGGAGGRGPQPPPSCISPARRPNNIITHKGFSRRKRGVKIQGEIAHAVGALVFGSSDNWNFNASNPCLHFGGNYNRNGNHGLFYVNYNSVSNANANIGCRVLLGLATHLHSSSSQAAERAPRPTGQGLLSPLLLLFLANPLMLGFARMGRGEGVIFLGTPWCRLANRTRFSTFPQPAGAVERS